MDTEDEFEELANIDELRLNKSGVNEQRNNWKYFQRASLNVSSFKRIRNWINSIQFPSTFTGAFESLFLTFYLLKSS